MKQEFYNRQQEIVQKPEDSPIVWRPSAYGVVENDKGEWLMVVPKWYDRYDLPGGGVEIEEDLRDGLKREFYEETGYTIESDAQPVHITERMFFHEALGYCHVLACIYRANMTDAPRDASAVNAQDEEEIERMAWVDPMTLTQDAVSPLIWPYIESLRNV